MRSAMIAMSTARLGVSIVLLVNILKKKRHTYICTFKFHYY